MLPFIQVDEGSVCMCVSFSVAEINDLKNIMLCSEVVSGWYKYMPSNDQSQPSSIQTPTAAFCKKNK